jgi:hypothetical protein
MNDCAGLVALTETELITRLGRPVTRKQVGSDLWLVFDSAEMRLRVRCCAADDGEGPRVVSWAATFATGHRTLEGAARAVGLWPTVAPDERADQVATPLIRRPVPCPSRYVVYSFTATVRQGLFSGVSVFDEEPDWL